MYSWKARNIDSSKVFSVMESLFKWSFTLKQPDWTVWEICRSVKMFHGWISILIPAILIHPSTLLMVDLVYIFVSRFWHTIQNLLKSQRQNICFPIQSPVTYCCYTCTWAIFVLAFACFSFLLLHFHRLLDSLNEWAWVIHTYYSKFMYSLIERTIKYFSDFKSYSFFFWDFLTF